MVTRTEIMLPEVQSFRTALTNGIDGIVKAAHIYVAAIDKDPRNQGAFEDGCSDILPHQAWAQFEAIGRRVIHPKLLFGGMASRPKAHLLKRLPYSAQERLLNRGKMELVCSGGDRLKVTIYDATVEQAKQLIGDRAVRTPEEQKAWMEAQKQRVAMPPEPASVMPYTITDGKVTFRRAVTLTKREVQRILQEL